MFTNNHMCLGHGSDQLCEFAAICIHAVCMISGISLLHCEGNEGKMHLAPPHLGVNHNSAGHSSVTPPASASIRCHYVLGFGQAHFITYTEMSSRLHSMLRDVKSTVDFLRTLGSTSIKCLIVTVNHDNSPYLITCL